VDCEKATSPPPGDCEDVAPSHGSLEKSDKTAGGVMDFTDNEDELVFDWRREHTSFGIG
jgi:hypothetical protein